LMSTKMWKAERSHLASTWFWLSIFLQSTALPT
jgi:hypothetical protein